MSITFGYFYSLLYSMNSAIQVNSFHNYLVGYAAWHELVLVDRFKAALSVRPAPALYKSCAR